MIIEAEAGLMHMLVILLVALGLLHAIARAALIVQSFTEQVNPDDSHAKSELRPQILLLVNSTGIFLEVCLYEACTL